MLPRKCFSVLGLKFDAGQEEVRCAFKEKARLYHPDKCNAPDAAERFRLVRQAFDVITKLRGGGPSQGKVVRQSEPRQAQKRARPKAKVLAVPRPRKDDLDGKPQKKDSSPLSEIFSPPALSSCAEPLFHTVNPEKFASGNRPGLFDQVRSGRLSKPGRRSIGGVVVATSGAPSFGVSGGQADGQSDLFDGLFNAAYEPDENGCMADRQTDLFDDMRRQATDLEVNLCGEQSHAQSDSCEAMSRQAVDIDGYECVGEPEWQCDLFASSLIAKGHFEECRQTPSPTPIDASGRCSSAALSDKRLNIAGGRLLKRRGPFAFENTTPFTPPGKQPRRSSYGHVGTDRRNSLSEILQTSLSAKSKQVTGLTLADGRHPSNGSRRISNARRPRRRRMAVCPDSSASSPSSGSDFVCSGDSGAEDLAAENGCASFNPKSWGDDFDMNSVAQRSLETLRCFLESQRQVGHRADQAKVLHTLAEVETLYSKLPANAGLWHGSGIERELNQRWWRRGSSEAVVNRATALVLYLRRRCGPASFGD